MNIEGKINIEKVTIGGIDYYPKKEYSSWSCIGCDLYHGRCTVNKVCKCFGNGIILKKKGSYNPTLKDHTTLRSYEDACIALNRSPLNLNLSDVREISDYTIAMIQLETIAEAIRGNEGPLLFDSRVTTSAYAPCFGHYMKAEMDDQPDVLQESALWIDCGTAVKYLFAMSHIAKIETNGYKCFNPRIMQHSYEKAQYLGGRHFIHLWAIYFGLIFDYDDFYIKQPI